VRYVGEEGIGAGVKFSAISKALYDQTSESYQRRLLPSPFAIAETFSPATMGLYPPRAIRSADLGLYEGLGASIWALASLPFCHALLQSTFLTPDILTFV
jgi:hypothetical protein